MIKEAIEKITELSVPVTYEIDGDTYSSEKLHRIEPHVDRPTEIEVSSLESLAELVKTELEAVGTRVFVRVESPRRVFAFTTYGDDMRRNELYRAVADTPEYRFGWKDFENAMIAFRSQFDQTEDVEYILALLSRITNEESVATEDNGLSQTVEARQGVALAAREPVRPRVKLRPFRTFLEVEQPESEFLLRLNGEGQIGLFEADGGMWTLDAKRSIKEYLLERLGDESMVTVMM